MGLHIWPTGGLSIGR